MTISEWPSAAPPTGTYLLLVAARNLGAYVSILGLNLTGTEPMKPILLGAGFWIRALARLIDYVWFQVLGLLTGINAAITLAILEALSIAEPGWAARIGESRVLLIVLALIGNVSYHTLCEGIHGASLGKLICGLRVRADDLTACGMKSALFRSLAFYLDSLFFGAVGYLEMQKTVMSQRHGDRWARTVVVKTSQVPEDARRSSWRFLYAFALGSAAWGLPQFVAIVWVAM